jgi:hypothetical protein
LHSTVALVQAESRIEARDPRGWERMAEIRIERKGRGLGWLWLLLALIVVAVLAWYFLYPGRATTAPAAAPPTTGSIERGASPPAAGAGPGHSIRATRQRV